MAKKTIPRTCETCNVPFLAETHEVNRGNAWFCSKLCANRSTGKARIKPPNATCEECGQGFYARPSHILANKGKYCSKNCYDAARGTLEERFWPKVDKTPGHGPQGECWVWTAATTNGYGTISRTPAHRVSWEIHNGQIPDGLCVLHRCDNPPCVRPDHHFLGTKKDNAQDAVAKGRWTQGGGRKILSETDVIEIRRRYAAGGITFAQLGKEYGVGSGAVNHIVHRRTWSHI